MRNSRSMRVGVAGAAALAMFAGTVHAQQQHQQHQQQQWQQQRQLDQQVGLEYRDVGEWQTADFVPELSQEIVVLHSDTNEYDAKVHILYGQVQAKLDDERIPTQQVEKRGDQLRLLDQEGETVAEFTLPDLQMIQQARMTAQPGVIDRQFGIPEQRWQEDQQWRRDGWQRDPGTQRDWRQQEDWRFRDQQRTPMRDDWRFRDDQMHDDWRFRDDQMMRDDRRFRTDQRFDRDREWGMERDRFEPTMRPIEQQLGVSVTTASPRELQMTRYREGLEIQRVQRGSPLDQYGIRPGDIIVAVDGRPATHTNLQRTITRMDHRDTMRMTVVRDGRERTLNLRGTEIVGHDQFDQRFERDRFERFDRFERDRRVLGAPDPTFRAGPMIGVQIDEARRSDLQRTAVGARYDTGVEVTRVLSGSPADRAGLRRGDIIVEIDGQPNITTSEFRQELGMLRPGDTLNVTVIRNGRERDFNIRVRERDVREFQRIQPMFEEPSRQERLLTLPGHVPPGPGVHYQPGIDEPRWDRRRDVERWDDRRWDDQRWEDQQWERRDTWETFEGPGRDRREW